MRQLNRRQALATTAASAAALIGIPPAVRAQETRIIRFGHLNNTDHPMSMGARRFGELLAAKSGGKITVKEFPSSQLGNELQQQSALQGGVQDMTAPAPSSLAGIVKEFGLLDFPFILSDFAQADALLDGPLGTALLNKLPEKGLIGLTFFDLGFRSLTNNRRPIARLEDIEGLKMRVIPNPVFIETFKALKANPLPMPFAEVYGAMESRAIDGHENAISVVLSNKIYEVQKYLSISNHIYASNIILVSKRTWDKLTPAEQTMFREAALETRAAQRAFSRDIASKAVGELKSRGMQVNQISAAELARMRQAVQPVIDKFSADYDPKMVALFHSELDRVHKL